MREAEESLRLAFEMASDLRKSELLGRGSWLMFHNPEALIERAGSHPVAHDALRLVLADMVKNQAPIPDVARLWLAQYLRGEADRPKDRAGAKADRFLHEVIWHVIRDLKAMGLQPTKNLASLRDDVCGCDAVAKAMKNLGAHPQDHDRIRKIWFSMQQVFVGRKSK